MKSPGTRRLSEWAVWIKGIVNIKAGIFVIQDQGFHRIKTVMECIKALFRNIALNPNAMKGLYAEKHPLFWIAQGRSV